MLLQRPTLVELAGGDIAVLTDVRGREAVLDGGNGVPVQVPIGASVLAGQVIDRIVQRRGGHVHRELRHPARVPGAAVAAGEAGTPHGDLVSVSVGAAQRGRVREPAAGRARHGRRLDGRRPEHAPVRGRCGHRARGAPRALPMDASERRPFPGGEGRHDDPHRARRSHRPSAAHRGGAAGGRSGVVRLGPRRSRRVGRDRGRHDGPLRGAGPRLPADRDPGDAAGRGGPGAGRRSAGVGERPQRPSPRRGPAGGRAGGGAAARGAARSRAGGAGQPGGGCAAERRAPLAQAAHRSRGEEPVAELGRTPPADRHAYRGAAGRRRPARLVRRPRAGRDAQPRVGAGMPAGRYHVPAGLHEPRGGDARRRRAASGRDETGPDLGSILSRRSTPCRSRAPTRQAPHRAARRVLPLRQRQALGAAAPLAAHRGGPEGGAALAVGRRQDHAVADHRGDGAADARDRHRRRRRSGLRADADHLPDPDDVSVRRLDPRQPHRAVRAANRARR